VQVLLVGGTWIAVRERDLRQDSWWGRRGTVATRAILSGVEIVGLDHVYLAVKDFARSMAFYDPVMKALGFFKGDRAIAGERHAHYFNRAL
jgi:hypothetical protein